MPVSTKAHHTQLPATPLRRTMSVTRFGVSALKVVATIDSPASHHGTARPDPKNSEVLRPARFPKNSAGPKQMSSDAKTMTQSSVVSRMTSRRESMRSWAPRSALSPLCGELFRLLNAAGASDGPARAGRVLV
jgi:hypothetical protein